MYTRIKKLIIPYHLFGRAQKRVGWTNQLKKGLLQVADKKDWKEKNLLREDCHNIEKLKQYGIMTLTLRLTILVNNKVYVSDKNMPRNMYAKG